MPKSRWDFSLLAAGVLGTTDGGLLGETGAKECPGMLDNALDKSFSTSSSMLGLVTVSLGHWRSLQTSRQLRHLQVLLLSALSIMTHSKVQMSYA